jgi:hypothetical protein
MTVTVTGNDGVLITYGYDPAHYEGVVKFYQDLQDEGKIQGYLVHS